MRYRPGPGFRPMLAKAEELPGPGDRVSVGPVWPATAAYTKDGVPRPAKAEERDGFEGPGVIEGVDGPLARVRLEDGRVIVGVKRSRLSKREGEGNHESEDKRAAQ